MLFGSCRNVTLSSFKQHVMSKTDILKIAAVLWWGLGQAPHSRAPWHTECFETEEFEKMAKPRRSLWPSPPIIPSCERYPPIISGKQHLFLQNKRTLKRILSKQDLLISHSFVPFLTHFNLSYPSMNVHSSSNPAQKYINLGLPWWSSD